MMRGRWGLATRDALVASMVAATAATAQSHVPLTVSGEQGLAFGALLPGVATVVAAQDAFRHGRFRIEYPPNTTLQVSVTLPTALVGPGGARLPVTFGPGDALWVESNGVASAFDPRTVFTTRTRGRDAASLLLGATARPASTQSAGRYQGGVMLTIIHTGL